MKLKRTASSFLLAIALLLSFISVSQAQGSFEGRIEFEITYSELPPEMQSMEGMLPKSLKLFVNDQRSLTEMSMGMMGTQRIILDMSKTEGHLLMDMMGQKIAVDMSEEMKKAESENQDSEQVEYFDEYKTIAGYKCQKAIVTTKTPEGGTTVSTVYFTKKIPNITQNNRVLKGMALQYSMDTNGVKSIVVAKVVSKETIANSTFEIPQGYEFKTMEELGNGL
jgi:GLPGLI family protein